MRRFLESLVPDGRRLACGNESADLDSLASALCLAAFRGATPLALVPRADLALRTDARCALARIGADLARYPALDDAWAADATPDALWLADVQKPPPGRAAWAGAVRAVLDHHADERNADMFPRCELREVVVPLGSASTLVGRHLAHELVLAGDDLARDAAHLLLDTIVLDTANFHTSRATPLDLSVARFLFSLAVPNSASADFGAHCNAAFDALSAAKSDCTGLTAAQLLRRDYKTVGPRLGASAVTLPLSEFFERAASEPDVLVKFASERQIDALLFFGLTFEPFERQLGLWFAPTCDSTSTLRELRAFIESYEDFECKFVSEEQGCILWKQGNVSYSRKKVVPVLLEFLASKQQ